MLDVFQKERALEASVLGTIIADNSLLNDYTLQAEYFELEVHKTLYKTFEKLKASNTPINVATILAGNMSGLIAANELMFISNSANAKHFEKHIQLLFERYQRKQTAQILRQAIEDEQPIHAIVKSLQDIETNKASDYHSITQLLSNVLEKPFQQQNKAASLKTGLETFDMVTGGLRNELIILAARPSMGKTAVALNLMRYLTQNNSNVVPVFFSLEMSAESITDRLIATCGRYDSRKLDNPHLYLTDAEKARWTQTLDAVNKINLETFDSAAQTISDIRRKTRQMARKHAGKQIVVFVDYLQIIRAENRSMSEYERLNEISKELKELAKSYGPVICLSQLNRGNESRNDKRPSMSDLKGSGNIEADADIVACLYREDYYEQNPANHNNELEISIQKNRNGAVGTVTMHFDRTTQTIFEK